MNKIIAFFALLFLPLNYAHSASLCDSANCNVTLVFEAGGGISANYPFTLRLGAEGKIAGVDPINNIAVAPAADNIITQTQLTFSNGGEIIINGGNIEYVDGDRLELNGVMNFKVDHAANVAFDTINSIGTVSLYAPNLTIKTPTTPFSGIAIHSSSALSAIDINASDRIQFSEIVSAASIALSGPMNNTVCTLQGNGSTTLNVDVIPPSDNNCLQPAPATDVKAIWLGQDVSLNNSNTFDSTFRYLSYENTAFTTRASFDGFQATIDDPWNTTTSCMEPSPPALGLQDNSTPSNCTTPTDRQTNVSETNDTTNTPTSTNENNSQTQKDSNETLASNAANSSAGAQQNATNDQTPPTNKATDTPPTQSADNPFIETGNESTHHGIVHPLALLTLLSLPLIFGRWRMKKHFAYRRIGPNI